VSRPHLAVEEVAAEFGGARVLVRAAGPAECLFPPLLAAQLLIDVDGLVHQSCLSQLSPSGRRRRWAFAQEIYANGGRGTEAGHFLEHLVLELLAKSAPAAPRFTGETSWDFRAAPGLFTLRFRKVGPDGVFAALKEGAEILARRGYHVGLDAARRVAPPRAPRRFLATMA
jgi:hypothetical protein